MTARTSPGSVLCLLAAALPGAALAVDWRPATVHELTTRAAVDASVNLDCVPGRPDARVVVVRYRVGKSHALRAVALAPGDAFTPGEAVRIDVADCRVEHRAGPAAAPASAP